MDLTASTAVGLRPLVGSGDAELATEHAARHRALARALRTDLDRAPHHRCVLTPSLRASVAQRIAEHLRQAHAIDEHVAAWREGRG